MYPAKEELESKWWHRLVKVLIILATIFATVVLFIFSVQFSDLLLVFLIIPIMYFGLWFFYKKVILYIVYGKRGRKEKKFSDFPKKFKVEEYDKEEVNKIRDLKEDSK